jgi:hypothetical protein
MPSCTDHSYQWKIWGPHNRGISLCEKHKKILGASDPADLIYLIVTAKAPIEKRGRYQSLPNPFRLRRMINRNRPIPLTFAQLELSIKSLQPASSKWGNFAQKNYNFINDTFSKTVSSLDRLERDLLVQIKAFYQKRIDSNAASQIAGLQIEDRYSRPGEKPKYSVRLKIADGKEIGRLIGKGGVHINELCKLLNLKIDLD